MRNFVGLIGILALLVFVLFNKKLDGTELSRNETLPKPIETLSASPLKLICQPLEEGNK